MRQEEIREILLDGEWRSMADIMLEWRLQNKREKSDEAHAHRIINAYTRYKMVESREVPNPAPIQRNCKPTIREWRWVG